LDFDQNTGAPLVLLRPSQKPPIRILDHGGEVILLVMTREINIG